MSQLPLSGIKVLDLTRVLAGPLCTQMLGDLGADVIKIERPETGDDTRGYGPPYLMDSFFLCANRNKRSVTVNIAKLEGQQVIRELAKDCDVFIENYKVGDLKRYGLDYEEIRKINSRVIYCSVTGFGQTGPYAARPGYDPIAQAMGGIMSVTGHMDGEPGAGPMKAGPAIVDYMTGQNASIGILAALYHRLANGGQGQHVDINLLDTTIASLSQLAQVYVVTGRAPPRLGTWGTGALPAGVFRCVDGELMISVGTDAQFARMCTMLGQPELATNPKFVKEKGGKEMMAILAGLFLKNRASYWLEELVKAGIPCGPVNDFPQVFADPHVRSRGMVVKIDHPVEQSLSLIRNPLTFSETPVRVYRYPPNIGEHTQQILSKELGYDNTKIAELKRAAVI